MPAPAASVFPQPGLPAHWGALAITPGATLTATLGPSCIPQHVKDRGLQTHEILNFNTALKQLQVVTGAKFQLKQELLHEQQKQETREDELIATHNREIDKIGVGAEKEIDEMTLQFQGGATRWKGKLADKQEGQWAMIHKWPDSALREVLAQVEPADTVRILTWFFSTADNPGTAPTCSMGKVLATAMQWRLEDLMTPLQDSRAFMLLCLWLLLCKQAAQHLGLTLCLL